MGTNSNEIFIKVTDPSISDIEYTQMLLKNWHNFYKPHNYLLPNTMLITPGDRHMTDQEMII